MLQLVLFLAYSGHNPVKHLEPPKLVEFVSNNSYHYCLLFILHVFLQELMAYILHLRTVNRHLRRRHSSMKRIDARLSEHLRQAQQAQAGTSNVPVVTRVKGKGHELTAEELEEQLNKLKEEELRCKAIRQSIQDRLIMMKPPRQAPKTVQQAPQPHMLLQ